MLESTAILFAVRALSVVVFPAANPFVTTWRFGADAAQQSDDNRVPAACHFE